MRAVAFAIVIGLTPTLASAQTDGVIGVRAHGMAGAFTAVADDASATWWNPAGLGGGAYFSAILEFTNQREPAADRTEEGALAGWRAGSGGFAVAYPALGLSYYRLRINEISATDGGVIGREDPGTAAVRLRTLAMSQFGATTGQSIGEHLIVASTFKLVRGGVAAAGVTRATASFDAAADLDHETETHVGLDIGVMAALGSVRLGLGVRNVREIEFGEGADAVTLKRHARAGVAYSSALRTRSGGLTFAVDADLTTETTATGDERRVAAGIEAWSTRRLLGIRGGVGANTIGERRASFSGGFSAAVREGLFVDLAITRGGDRSRRGWAADLRVTF